MRNVERRLAGLLALVFALLMSGCGDEIVYRDQVAFVDPPPAAANFLGYADEEAKKTVCGNCHAGKQAAWAQTKHASAWASLENSGHSASYCEGCHTVSALGNAAETDSVGWTSTHDTRYYDVQCESCHGAGLGHVLNPDANMKPLAPMGVDTAFNYGCGECHSGTHTPFLEEWQESGHSHAYASRETNPSCTKCHEARGILEAWGFGKPAHSESPTQYMRQTCALCHDPHNATNDNQLRLSVSVADTSQNLCMRCHNRRIVPELTSTRGPHAAQAPVLLGMGGWIPASFTFQPRELVATHGSSSNEKLCVTCHITPFSTPNTATGETFYSTGHTFQATPCVNADGIPTGAADCAMTERSFRGCVGCHGTESAARTAMSVAELRIETLALEIDSLIVRIPSTEFSITDGRTSTGEGARFNRDMARMSGNAVHNPFYMEALLLASIKQIQTDYGVRFSSVPMSPQLAPRP